MKHRLIFFILLSFFLSKTVHSQTKEYSLEIAKSTINVSGELLTKLTINGSLPGPILEFQEGDEVVIHVSNNLTETTSIHWHGLLLPGEMDGVPEFNGFPGIPAGSTFTYRFPLRQSGTYWYHAHSQAQEQDGVYGAFIIKPAVEAANEKVTEHVILLSDFHRDSGHRIMANLKKSSEYYVYVRQTVFDFFSNVQKQGFKQAWNSMMMWGDMRMLPTDLSDVNNYTHLMNGKTGEQNWTALFTPDKKQRLRFINASAMSFYDVRIPGLKMTLIEADGQPVEPVNIDEFRLAVAETYDVLVEPEAGKVYTIVAEPIDRQGFALGTLAEEMGVRGDLPTQRPLSLLTMADMGMGHGDHSQHPGMSKHSDHTMKHSGHSMKNDADHAAHSMHMMNSGGSSPSTIIPSSDLVKDFKTGVPGSGWVRRNAPEEHKILSYRDLKYPGTQKDLRLPEREIIVRLGGNMERYIWTLNGKKYEESEPLQLRYGERVRLTFINDTMMAHPMHLHGMFVQLENGQPMAKLPNKHTITIAPGDTYSALVTADEVGEWAFHCHLLYHMMAGMMGKVVVAKYDGTIENNNLNVEEVNHHVH